MSLITFPAHRALLLDLHRHWAGHDPDAQQASGDTVMSFLNNWLDGDKRGTLSHAPDGRHLIAAYTTLEETREMDQSAPTARQVFMALYARRTELQAEAAEGKGAPADLLLLEEYERTIDSLREQMARVWTHAPVGKAGRDVEIGGRVSGRQSGRVVSIVGPEMEGEPAILELDNGERVSALDVEVERG